ncbi:unnamed protein product [Darwinula stevensoni]|uniref:Uncharacterized protein n=1 Tax=Darwinula stevensoni TaxID=69355 RepID=A0A7R8X1X9_9CRUS|nr:unnamed protein product [Darwinula stevensoni]CAG0880853.1 unnamed protein product [Darwinula stevensoni]
MSLHNEQCLPAIQSSRVPLRLGWDRHEVVVLRLPGEVVLVMSLACTASGDDDDDDRSDSNKRAWSSSGTGRPYRQKWGSGPTAFIGHIQRPRQRVFAYRQSFGDDDGHDRRRSVYHFQSPWYHYW